jgi:hypothetical protein
MNLGPAIFVLYLPVALARIPENFAFGSGGRVKILLAWTLVDATNHTRCWLLPLTS